MGQIFDNSILDERVWNRNIEKPEFFFSNYKINESDVEISLEEEPIPIKFVWSIMAVTMLGAMITIWSSELEIGWKQAMTIIGAAAAPALMMLLITREQQRKAYESFRGDKINQVLILGDEVSIPKREIVFFRAYLRQQGGYPYVLISVGYQFQKCLYERTVVALTGPMRKNEVVGRRLASYFCSPLLIVEGQNGKEVSKGCRNGLF